MLSPEQVVAVAAADPSTPYGAAVAAARASVAASESPVQRVARLTQDLADAQAELEREARPLYEGRRASSSVDFAALAQRIGTLKVELSEAHGAALEAQATARRAQREENEKQFWNSVEAARVARSAFQRAFRDAAVALGTFCQRTETAMNLSNALGDLIRLPERDNAISELTTVQNLNPLNALLDDGFQPTLGYGYNINISIPVLRRD